MKCTMHLIHMEEDKKGLGFTSQGHLQVGLNLNLKFGQPTAKSILCAVTESYPPHLLPHYCHSALTPSCESYKTEEDKRYWPRFQI